MWFLAMMIVVGISNAQPGMLYEHWILGGTADSMLDEPLPPDSSEIMPTSFWDGTNTEQYRARLTGYIMPPVTGNYTFWMNSDDNGRLWLSTDSSPANYVLIATETGSRAVNNWATAPAQEVSDPIPLVGGAMYWMRAGYQEGTGGDHIHIGWASPEAGIADHTTIGAPYLWVTPPDKAYSPVPFDGEWFRYSTDVTELEWTLPLSTADSNEPEIVNCDVLWFGTDPESTPELLVDNAAVELISLGLRADAPAHYYWRVDCYDVNGLDITKTEGELWTFSSARDIPMVFVDESGLAGEESTDISEELPIPSRDDYLLSLSSDPGSDTVTITVNEVPTNDPLSVDRLEFESWNGEATAAPLLSLQYGGGIPVLSRVNADDDDLEEYVDTGDEQGDGSSDLEFFDDSGTGRGQIIACRFNSVAVPQGATIDSAVVEFEVDVSHAAEVYGFITGENVDDALPLVDAAFHIRDRLAANPTSSLSFSWTASYANDAKVVTPDIASIIQEIVDRPGWTSGKSIVIFFTEDLNPDDADIELIAATDPWGPVSSTYVLDTTNWEGVTVTIAAIDDEELEPDPDTVTLEHEVVGTGVWAGVQADPVEVSIIENECGAWSFEAYDFNQDCVVDIADLVDIVDVWLTCTMPNIAGSGCVETYKP